MRGKGTPQHDAVDCAAADAANDRVLKAMIFALGIDANSVSPADGCYPLAFMPRALLEIWGHPCVSLLTSESAKTWTALVTVVNATPKNCYPAYDCSFKL